MPQAAIDGLAYMKETADLVGQLLDRFLPGADKEPATLHTAMRYSVMAGGKRLRPGLALAAWEYCQRDLTSSREAIYSAMAGLEMVHTYSLIHDDLPCMDDDDLRRGIPTCHKKFGEAVAVLAGDALHVEAFQRMACTGSNQAVLELAEAIGTEGMLGGQIADVEAEGKKVTREIVDNIHRRKTGALIRGSVRIGAILAGASDEKLAMLTTYGEKIGLAFQVIDDILDIEGNQELLGKEVGSDCRNDKATFPAVVGLDEARRVANKLTDEALSLFEGQDDNVLMFIARYIGRRER